MHQAWQKGREIAPFLMEPGMKTSIGMVVVASAMLVSALVHSAEPVRIASGGSAIAQTAGAVIIIPASAELRRPNDEAHLTFTGEEQDKDKAQAASRLNLKIRRGLDILKQQDATAVLQTRGYYTYPVYQDSATPVPRSSVQARTVIGWRVGQAVDFTTFKLDSLPQTVAAVQQVLALNGLNFALSTQASKKADEERISLVLANLNERIGYIARSLGKSPADAVIDTIDFEGSGAFASNETSSPKMMMRAAVAPEVSVAEPSFEPGESALSIRLVGRVRFR
jgi:predicted secreted protein